jgi:Protein of unknown function (DUF3987)/Bifunctional DNA primase/polymerase, N-terminal
MMTPLEAALAYAKEGYAVFPCSAAKEPCFKRGLIEHGLKDATRDPVVVHKFWTEWNYGEIGCALELGVAVIDLDEKNGKHGIRDFIARDGRNPLDLETPISTTVTGGLHIWFHTNGRNLAQWQDRPEWGGIESRVGGKGYVILPMPGNGRRWAKPRSTPLMDAPVWWPEDESEPGRGEANPFEGQTSARAQEALDRACAALASAPPGHRDSTIARVVFRLARLCGAGEADPESALEALLKAMASNPGTDKSHSHKVERCFRDGLNKPAEPGPIDDVRSIDDDFSDGDDDGARASRASSQQQQMSSSAGGAQSASSGWDPIDLGLFLAGSELPPPELSDDALPQSWAEIIRAYAAVAEAPPDYVAIATIAGAAGAIGNAYVVEGKRGWREPAVLWGVPIGPPSAHKTPAMKAAHSALAAIDHELYVEWKKECEQIEVQHQMALDAQAAENESKKTVKKPEKPPLKHLLHDDTSLEKLTINMAASPHGAVAFYSELAEWFASFSRYSSGGDDSSGRALWNRAYDAERFKRDRVKNEGPPIVVPAAACSVVGAIQPDKVRHIWPKSHDGLLARPIYVWPRLAPLPSEESDDADDDISGGETYAFRKAFKALYDLPLGLDDEGVPHPAVLRLASDARSPFNAAKRDCERRARRERGLLGEWLGKSPGR